MGSCFSSSDDEEKCRQQNRASVDEHQKLFPNRRRTASYVLLIIFSFKKICQFF